VTDDLITDDLERAITSRPGPSFALTQEPHMTEHIAGPLRHGHARPDSVNP